MHCICVCVGGGGGGEGGGHSWPPAGFEPASQVWFGLGTFLQFTVIRKKTFGHSAINVN